MRKRDPLNDPTFTVDEMADDYYIERSDGNYILKIPKIEGRIYEREDRERDDTYIVFIADRYYDKETKQTHNKRVIIGSALGGRLEGLMVTNDNYSRYFSPKGQLVYDPLQKRKEQEAAEAAKKRDEQEAEEKTTKEETGRLLNKDENQQQKEKKNKQAEEAPTNRKRQTRAEEERTVDEIRAELLEKERLLNEKLQKAAEALRKAQAAREEYENLLEARRHSLDKKVSAHIELLRSMLYDYQETIHNLAKRKPDHPMRLQQIRTVNEVLQELRDYFKGSEAEDYLHLAPEPIEDDLKNHPGTTYGEMDLLLSAYTNTIHAFNIGNLYSKN